MFTTFLFCTFSRCICSHQYSDSAFLQGHLRRHLLPCEHTQAWIYNEKGVEKENAYCTLSHSTVAVKFTALSFWDWSSSTLGFLAGGFSCGGGRCLVVPRENLAPSGGGAFFSRLAHVSRGSCNPAASIVFSSASTCGDEMGRLRLDRSRTILLLLSFFVRMMEWVFCLCWRKFQTCSNKP